MRQIHPALFAAGGHPYGTLTMSSGCNPGMSASIGGPPYLPHHQPSMNVHSPLMASQPTAASDGCVRSVSTGALKPMSPTEPIEAAQYHHQVAQPSAPTSTLFVANMGANTTEGDLREIFGT